MSDTSLDNRRQQPPYQGQQQKRQQQTVPRHEHYVCSPILVKTAAFLLRRRLLFPFILAPAGLILGPPLVISFLAGLTYLSGGTLLDSLFLGEKNGVHGEFQEKYRNSEICSMIITSGIILTSSFIMVQMGKNTIRRHAPNKNAEKKALKQSEIALEFWSLALSVLGFRGTLAILARIFPNMLMARNSAMSEGWMEGILGLLIFSSSWAIQALKICVRPAWGWGLLNLLVFGRYAGPLCSIVRCSCTPLKTNPFDLILQKIGCHFTSKTRFLDMIAGFLDKVSAPSAPQRNHVPQPGRYQQPVSMSEGQLRNHNHYSNGSNNNNNFPNTINQSPPAPTLKNLANGITSSARARYNKPSFLSYLIQVIISAIGGHVFAMTVILPYLGMLVNNQTDDDINIVTPILLLVCMLTPVVELFTSNGISDNARHELHFSRYSSLPRFGSDDDSDHLTRLVVSDLFTAMKISVSGYYAVLCPLASAVIVPAYTYLSRFHGSNNDIDLVDHGVENNGSESISMLKILQCIAVPYISIAVLMTILSVQEVLTRWAICAVGLDVDLLLSRSMPSASTTNSAAKVPSAPANTPKTTKSNCGGAQLSTSKFLVEDLFVQSILCGDANTVNQVNARPGSYTSCFRPMQCTQDEEIERNETASSSFADWIQYSSTTSMGALSEDVLRLCLLESLGGRSTKPRMKAGPRLFDFGQARHTSAIRRRLRLSAATSCPGKDPIAIPVVRSLCAFAGGMGQAATRFYHRDIPVRFPSKEVAANNPPSLADSWVLPPGSLDAAEFAMNAAARLVVMNMVTQREGVYSVDITKRHDRLSLLLPCVLRSAFQLHCGMLDYAIAQAERNGEKISSYDPDGKGDGLMKYIEARLPDIEQVLATCDEAAKMVMRIINEFGERPMEALMSGGNGDLHEWLVHLDLS